ncbi:cobalamin receptor [Rodentibacter rarus]|uniref:TonB-dependent receptor plug domain-containing protein n=1 Tax=Rodentibacter rarus TaxID=1908260 RepID=UPI0009878962|nr:TonB-dependent receptor [Rodentibacter rarus]OOF36072.1 cobalamin receptor [Rodentibacter rarus]
MKKNLITTALLLGASTFVYGESSGTELPSINVYSAYATPINQDQTASSVTVLTEKDFAARNATYVSDVLKTVPGVAIGANGGVGSPTSLFLRGADSNQTAVIIDGVKMNPVNGYGFDFGGLALSNIERIEVLRGEQSALWGSDAMGGVVYITTKSGLYKDKPFNIDFDLGVGSHRTRDGAVTVSGYNEGFYYSLHGNSHRTSGISALSNRQFSYSGTNGAVSNRPAASEKDKFHRDNVSARIGYDDNQKGIEFLTSHSSQTVDFDNSTSDEMGHATRTRETLYKLSGYLGNEEELFKHKINLSRIKTDRDVFSSYSSAYDAKRSDVNYQLDINFDREGEITQSVSLLADYNKSNYLGTEYSNKLKINEKSTALEYRLLSKDDHSFSISGRYIDNTQYGNAFTARLSGAYRLSQNLRAHASLGTATQTPTLVEYFGYPYYSIPNFGLKAEKSRGGEVGLLMETTDKKYSLDATYFARNVKDLIADQPLPGSCYATSWGQSCTYQSVNMPGTSHIRGVELVFNGKLTDKLSSYANYTYTQAKDSSGKQLIRRPKHTANAGITYQITAQLGSSANISYVGKRRDNNTFRYRMPSYTLVNLGVNYQLTKNLNIYTNLNNLFDKKYENVVGYGQDGRNIYVGLRGSF